MVFRSFFDYNYFRKFAYFHAINKRRPQARRWKYMDIISVGLVLFFFLLSWGLVALCEHL